MEPFFTFLGNFWWLIFPAMGVMAAVGNAWERNARRRHRRRLEVLHAKAELKAAQAAARGRTGAIPIQTSPSATPATAAMPTTPQTASTTFAAGSTAAQLERLFAAHDAVTARWLEYELDVAKIIAFPAMSDGRQPLTAGFLRAKRVADNLRPPTVKARLTKEQLAEYRNAVADYEVAFDVAERDARRLKDSTFTEGERKRLETAKQLLTVAIDQAATPAERQLAYRRVREELDGLISLSDGAIEILEEKVMLEITTGAEPQAAPGVPATAGDVTGPSTPAGTGAASQATPHAAPPPAEPKAGPWPVPARTTDTTPGRVVHPKPRP